MKETQALDGVMIEEEAAMPLASMSEEARTKHENALRKQYALRQQLQAQRDQSMRPSRPS